MGSGWVLRCLLASPATQHAHLPPENGQSLGGPDPGHRVVLHGEEVKGGSDSWRDVKPSSSQADTLYIWTLIPYIV